MDIKYDKIGTGYNSTRQADPYLAERLLYHLRPKTDRLYLDIGCGTGNYTITFADKDFKFIGVEPSEKMLNEARSRNQDINWLQGTAEQIPADDKMFDGIIATLTIHHWTDLKKAFVEIDRVLSANGRFVLFTSTPEQMKGYWLNHYFPKMLHSSIVQMPSLVDIQEAIEQTELEITGIEKYFIKDDLQDCFLYVGKNNPTRYFDEAIRNGISSFSSLANMDEVKQGLSKLRNDIDDQAFDKIKGQYINELGDYLFITITKKTTYSSGNSVIDNVI
ncbi:class I SAM-dependent methyltransferase [Taibaiella helva]|uniref:class I SAM-dependent methyltransferase n=1 Tax=Taibaiella helva TaxID=2301235 RepID=UPI000E5853A1|nr:class I SAM-dependent methyltransferase [Taibaiella helva]